MSLKDTYKHLRELLSNISSDLEKSENGNKAASQRVRTGTVRLEKVAKMYRKESIASEKKTKGQKKPGKSAGAKSKSPAAKKAKTKTASKAKAASVKARPKAKTAQVRTNLRPRQLSMKRATAKLLTRRATA